MEIRIKYSEGCYHSLPYLHVDEAISSEVGGAFVTYVTNRRVDEIEKDLLQMMERENSVIILGCSGRLTEAMQSYVADRKLSLVSLPTADPGFSFLPTIIAGQLLSYYAALVLDERKMFFIELTEAIRTDSFIEEKWAALEVAIANGTFDEGFSIVQFIHLQSLFSAFKNDLFNRESESGQHLLSFLGEMHQFARRPIDTVKHQAKTITVGAVRESPDVGWEPNLIEQPENESVQAEAELGSDQVGRLASLIDDFEDQSLFERIGKFRTFFIYVDGLGETYRNFVVNFCNEISNKSGLNITFRPAKYYELSMGAARADVFWIFICDGIKGPVDELLRVLGQERYVSFDFSLMNAASCTRPIPNSFQAGVVSADYALGCCYVAHVLMKGLCRMYGADTFWVNYARKELKDLSLAWAFVATSRQIVSELRVAARLFLSKRHWKCIGSGVNYNIARYTANKLTSQFNRPCAFDVLENHKHIDVSAEAVILTFVANIWRPRYQSDVLAEIEKLLSHNNVPIIVTNVGDSRFDDLRMRIDYGVQKDIVVSPVIVQLPRVSEVYAYPLNVLLVTKMIEELTTASEASEFDCTSAIARGLLSPLGTQDLFEDSGLDVGCARWSRDAYSAIALNDPSTLGIPT